MLIWKFFRMVWTTHAATAAPDPFWTIPPERFIDLHPRLTNLTPSMIQTLVQGTTKENISIMNIITKKMKSSWIQRGISPATEGSRLHDPLVQPWTYIEQPGTPQQNNFNNTTETRLACGTIQNSRNKKFKLSHKAEYRPVEALPPGPRGKFPEQNIPCQQKSSGGDTPHPPNLAPYTGRDILRRT